MSMVEDVGPKTTMKRKRSLMSQRRGTARYSGSMRSQGIAIWEMSYSRFCMRICRELMGLKGSQHDAIRMLKTLPKLEDATILMYLMLLDVSLASCRSNLGIREE